VQELRTQEEVGTARHATQASQEEEVSPSMRTRVLRCQRAGGRERTSAKRRGTAKRARAARSGWTKRSATPATYFGRRWVGGLVGWWPSQDTTRTRHVEEGGGMDRQGRRTYRGVAAARESL
jgi:hypothetical protein